MELNSGIRTANRSSKFKVRVFVLNQAEWKDCGTGYMNFHKEWNEMTDEEEEFIEVIAIDPDKFDISIELAARIRKNRKNCVLFSKISKDINYERQKESIISFTDDSIQEDFALSFLDQHYASEIWKHLCMASGKTADEDKNFDINDVEHLMIPTRFNLESAKIELEANKSWIANLILQRRDYINSLAEIFEELENDKENSEADLDCIFQIFKSLILSGNVQLIELLLSDKYYMTTFGAFEYHPDNKGKRRNSYRNFFAQSGSYKTILNIDDPDIIKKIHTNFRLNFLKDSIIASYIDEAVSTSLNTMIYYKNIEIINHITTSPKDLISQLLTKFQDNYEDSINFLTEFLLILKDINQVLVKFQKLEARINTVDVLVKRRIYAKLKETLKFFISNSDPKSDQMILKSLNILSHIIQIQSVSFLSFLLEEKNDSKNFCDVFTTLLSEYHLGIQIEVVEILKFLMDPLSEFKNQIQDLIYTQIMKTILDKKIKIEKTAVNCSFLQQYIELLNFCIKNHGFKIRQFLIQNKVVQKMYKTLEIEEKSVIIAVIKLFKQIIIAKDEFMVKYIVQNDLLDEIFSIFFKNCKRKNVISSSCLELFENFSKENTKKLIKLVCEKFKPQIMSNEVAHLFSKIFIKYEQMLEGPPNEATNQRDLMGQGENSENKIIIDQPLQLREKEHKEEEDYFEKDDDVEKAPKSELSKMEIEQNNEINNKIKSEGLKNMLSLREKINQKQKKDEEDERQTGSAFGMKKSNIFADKGHKPFKMEFSIGLSLSSDNLSETAISNENKRSPSKLDELKEEERGESIIKKAKF